MNRASQTRFSLTTLEDRLTPTLIYGLAPDFNQTLIASLGRLITFDSADPGTILSDRPIQGTVLGGESLQAIDFRPATGELYALTVFVGDPAPGQPPIHRGQIHTLDTTTGQLSSVGRGFPLQASRAYGFDFNPTVDRIRVTTTDAMTRIYGSTPTMEPSSTTAL